MITPTYIEMCLNNPDLWDLWVIKDGNRYWDVKNELIDKATLHDEKDNRKEGKVPIWYQEQLQNMVDLNNSNDRRVTWPYEILEEIKNLAFNVYDDGLYDLGFNEIWICYVVFEKFNKKWDFDTKQWVKV